MEVSISSTSELYLLPDDIYSMSLTDDMGSADEYEEEVLDPLDFVKPDIEIDSVVLHLSFARQLDSLMRGK